MPAPALDCPCGRSASYAACCGRFHGGVEPENAEDLMRSRYSAFVKRDLDYLFRTLHPDHEGRAGGRAAFERSMKSHFSQGFVYRRLEVLETSAPDREGNAKVLFIAHIFRRGRDLSFAELSYFAAAEGGLRYIAGRSLPLSALGSQPSSVTISRIESGGCG